MRVGYHLPQSAGVDRRGHLISVARRAEELGFDSLWVSDHLALPVSFQSPYPYTKSGEFAVRVDEPWLESLVSLSIVAAVTERVQLGTSVLVGPLRDTILLGRQVGTLACLAPGRMILGMGAGWLEEEFAVLGRSFKERGRYLDEQIEVLERLWSVSPCSFDGRYVSFPPVYAEPRPDPLPDLWIGGQSDSALLRAGRVGAAWHAAGVPPTDTLKAMLSKVRAAAVAKGRLAEDVKFTARVSVLPGEDVLTTILRRMARLREADCTHVVIDYRAPDIDDDLHFLDAVAELLQREGLANSE